MYALAVALEPSGFGSWTAPSAGFNHGHVAVALQHVQPSGRQQLTAPDPVLPVGLSLVHQWPALFLTRVVFPALS